MNNNDFSLLENLMKRKTKLIFTWIIAFIFIIFFIVNYYTISEFSSMYCTASVLCAVVSGTLALTSMVKNNMIKKSIYKNISFGFLFIFILTVIEVILLREYNYPLNGQIVNKIRLITMCFEYVIIILACILRLCNFNIRVCFSIYSVTLSFIAIVLLFSPISNLNLMGTIILLILTLFLCPLYSKDIISKSEVFYLVIYLILVTIYHGIMNFTSIVSEQNIGFVVFFKCVAYFTIYRTMNEFIFYREYNGAKRNLEESQKAQIELNKILNERNKTLTEFKILIDKSERRYNEIIASIKDGIIMTENDKITYINNAAISIANTSESIVGKGLNYFLSKIYLDNTITNAFLVNIQNSKKNNINNRQYRMKFVVKDKGEYEVFVVKINDIEKIIYINDVTEINKNHDIRREYEEYLKEEKVKDEFYSNISHELRTPINLIYSALQLNEIYVADKNIEKVAINNNAIKQNCLRLIRTINNFIDANKITEGYLVANKKVYNIVSVIENISLACTKYFERIDNNLIFDAVEEEIYVECDKEMIERAILNLLSNSVKYGEVGGNVLINIETEDDIVIIYVKSNHYTISEEIQPYLFDKFTKLNKSLNRAKEGSGLGLFLTKKILELNDGTISVNSNSNIGTEFIIRLNREYTIGPVEEVEEEFNINSVEVIVDTEFSDIYI